MIAFGGPADGGARVIRAVQISLLCGGSVSVVLTSIATGLWVVRRLTETGGYNSGISTIIAGAHAALSLLLLLGWLLLARARAPVLAGKAVFGLYATATVVTYAELGEGVAFPRPKPRETPYVSAPEVGWRLRPNYRGTYAGKPLRTNSEGFRSAEISLQKPGDTVRIVCLGDSLTFGHGVDEEHAVPQQLEVLLGARMPTRRWEVINTGVEGYCTFQEVAQLRRCLRYEPDLTVLLFCLNDVTEKYMSLRRFGGSGLDYHGVVDGSAERLLHVLAWLRPYSSLATALTPTRADAQRYEAYSVHRLWEDPNSTVVTEAWEQAERELDELRRTCETHGVGLLIAVVPFRDQLTDVPAIDAPQRRMERYTRSRGLAFVDVRPHLAAALQAGRQQDELYMDSSHLTVAGNSIITEAIAEQFRLAPSHAGSRSSSWQTVLAQGQRA